ESASQRTGSRRPPVRGREGQGTVEGVRGTLRTAAERRQRAALGDLRERVRSRLRERHDGRWRRAIGKGQEEMRGWIRGAAPTAKGRRVDRMGRLAVVVAGLG